jgi:hypothetical protein
VLPAACAVDGKGDFNVHCLFHVEWEPERQIVDRLPRDVGIAMATSLVNGLGGAAGFGEGAMIREDDEPSLHLDLSAVLPGGLNFFGITYTSLYLNYNGSITFGTPLEEYTPTAITGLSNIPIIAPYWADVDTRSGITAPSPGGTSTGSNLVWYDLDAAGHSFTATWDDVGYFSHHLDKVNAFQLRLIAVGTNGDFDIQFRYESINWTTGDASGGDGGLFGQVAVAGYSSGDGQNFFQMPQSGNQAAMLALPSASNVSAPGLFIFSVRQGVPVVAQFSIAAASADKAEGDSGPKDFTFTVSLTGDSSVERSVSYSVAGTGDHAASAADFVGAVLPSGILTFAAHQTEQTITVHVAGDTVVEADETFRVTLSNATGGASLGADKATGTIRNDDATRLAIAAAGADQAEGDSGPRNFTFTVTRVGDISVEHTVSYSVAGSGDHAASEADFVGGVLPSGTLTFAPDQTVQTITLQVQGDATVELDEGFSVTLSGASGGAVIETATATGTIRNDDHSVVSIAALSADKAEGNSGTTLFTFTVSLDQANPTSQTIGWSVTGSGGHAANAADFGGSAPFGTVTFAANETAKTVEIAVSGDTAVEFDEGFTVTLANASVGLALGVATASGLIRNDDAAVVSIAAQSASKSEGNDGLTPFTFTLSLGQASVTSQTVDWAVTGSGSHAAAALDFGGALPSGTVTFAAGETSQTVTVLVSGDATVELDEGFTVTLSNASAGLALGSTTASGTILNDDKSTVSIAALSATKPEGNSGTTFYTFAITLDQAGVAGQSVNWSVTGAGAHAADGADFGGALPAGSVSFAAGEISKVISIAVAGDPAVEFDEGFKVTLSDPSSALILGLSTASGTIQNDDRPVASITAAAAIKAEGNAGATDFTFTVSLDQAATASLSIDWAVAGFGVHAADAADFGGSLPSGRVDFAAGEISKTVTVLASGDSDVEFDEAFGVTLSNASTDAAIGTASATGTILNDDKSVVSIAAAAAIKAEGHAGTTAFTFTVSLDQAATTGQSVDWAVTGSGGHAADAGDFGGSLPAGSVSFAAGETTRTVTILAAGDSAVEFDEGFKVALSNTSSGLVLGAASAGGTILNDDAAVSVAALAASKAEGDSGITAFAFEVTLTGDSSVPHSVSYAVSGSAGHPADAADFAGGVFPGGTITFGVGETSKTIVVNVAGDAAFEADETFALGLSAPSAGLTIATGSATGTILNDDNAGPPQPTIVHDDAYVGLSGQTVQMSAANGVLFNDSGTNLTASLISGPAHGTLAVATDGSFTYTPTAGFAGTDSFTYLAFGGAGGETRTVDLHIARLTPSATLDLLSLSAEQQVAIAYTTFFGRGADTAGFTFWVDQFHSGLPRLGPTGVFSAIADAFGASTEAKALYPFLDHTQAATDAEIGGFLDSVYNNLFNRSVDAGGIAYWTGQIRQAIAAGQFVGSILDDIVGGARNSEAGQDVMTVLGKVAINLSYVHDQQRYHAPWTAVDDAAAATALLHAVTAEPQTVLIGVVQAYNLVIASLARADGFGDAPASAF